MKTPSRLLIVVAAVIAGPNSVPAQVRSQNAPTQATSSATAQSAKPESESEVVTMAPLEVFGQSQVTAVERRKNSNTISSFLSSDSVGVLPDVTLGDALTRLAGVNVVSAGEARAASVSIRGMEGKLNTVQINGISPAQANPLISGNLDDTRSFDVSLIPAEMVDSVEVVKSITADLDAESIGGMVNVETATAFSVGKRINRVKAEYRYREQGDETGYGGNVIFADTFGRDKQAGLFLNVVYKDNDLRPWRTEFRQANNPAPDAVPELERLDLRDPFTHEKDLTLNGSFDYKLNPDTQLFLRTTVSRRDVDEYVDQVRLFNMGARAGNWWFLDDAGNPLGTWNDTDGNGVLGSAGDTFVQARDAQGNIIITPRKESAGFRVQRLGRNRPDREFRTYSVDVGGKSRGTGWTLDYLLNASSDQHTYTGTQLQWDTPGSQRSLYRFRYDNTDTLFPDVEAYQVTQSNGFIAVTPRVDRFAVTNADTLNRIRFENGRFKETQWVGKLDYTRDLTSEFSLKVGGKIRSRDRDSLPTTIDWSPKGITVPRAQFASSYGDSFGAFDGLYSFTGRLLPNEPVVAFFNSDRASNPSHWSLSGLDINAIARSYTIQETVSAAYAMGTFTRGGLTVLGGVRAERTDQDITWKASNVDPLNAALPRLPDINRSDDYTDLFPSIVATYRLGERHVFRAAATQTIARPDYADIIPYDTERVSETYADSIGEFDEFPLGNPNLSPQKALNFDLGYEFYYGKHSSVSVTGFYKRLTDFLLNNAYQHQILVPSDPFDPNSPKVPATVTSTFVSNGAEQEIRGLELTWNGSFKDWLPAPFDGLGWVLNYTFIDGSQTEPVYDEAELANGRFVQTGERTGQGLTNQPERIANLQAYYDRGRFSIRLAYNYVDDFKLDAFTLGFAGRQAVNESLDGSVRFRLSRRHDVRLLLDVANITKERGSLLYVGREAFPEGFEQAGRTWVLGVQASF